MHCGLRLRSDTAPQTASGSPVPTDSLAHACCETLETDSRESVLSFFDEMATLAGLQGEHGTLHT